MLYAYDIFDFLALLVRLHARRTDDGPVDCHAQDVARTGRRRRGRQFQALISMPSLVRRT